MEEKKRPCQPGHLAPADGDKKYWCRFVLKRYSVFEVHYPWWVSGYDMDDHAIVCMALLAQSEENAKARVLTSFHGPADIEFGFVIEKYYNWEPFSSRFPRQEWMVWE